MSDYKLTQKAVEDLNNIWEYTCEKWSESQADEYYKILLETFQRIANNPNLGKYYEELDSNIYVFRLQQHIIFYRKINQKSMEIVRILHGKMDLKKHLK